MKDYSRLKEHCYQTLKLPTSPKTTAEHLMVLELIEYYEEHEAVLDKIRAEIVELDVFYDNDYFSGNKDAMLKRNEVLQIIDKYKAESEE